MKRKPQKASFLLEPFSFFEMRRQYPQMKFEEQILLYSITGGVPAYLQYFPADCCVQEKTPGIVFHCRRDFYRLVEGPPENIIPPPLLCIITIWHRAKICRSL